MTTLKNSSLAGKKISQNDLRRLMSDHKRKLVGAPKKIESPLAKYLDDGTIQCILCNSTVKTETLWNVHINAKIHKDNITRKKHPTCYPTEFLKPTAAIKREASEEEKEEVQNPPKKLKGILKNAPPLPEGFFDTVSVKSESESIVDPQPNNTISEEEKDFINSNENNKKEESMECESFEASLPEGFFDNPVLDAKARNVEYKDPMEEEWEKFQKEMKEENTVSAQIIQDDTEVATVERQIIEVDEQLKNWSRVIDLEKKKESVSSVKTKARDIKMEESSSSSEAEEYLDEFLDWRAKESYK